MKTPLLTASLSAAALVLGGLVLSMRESARPPKAPAVAHRIEADPRALPARSARPDGLHESARVSDAAPAAAPPAQAPGPDLPREDPPTEDVPGLPADAWRTDIGSPVPELRAGAVDLIPRDPESRGILEWLLENESDPYARERTVLAYGEALGRDAIPRLRQVALADGPDEVRDAALAALDLVDELHPRELRGSLELVAPAGAIASGTPFTIVARLSSRSAAPDAMFDLVPPDGVERLGPQDGPWKGSVAAGQTIELTYTMRFTGELPARAQFKGRLKLDFEEALDVEFLRRDLQMDLTSGKSSLSEVGPNGKPPARERTIELE